MAVSPFVNKYDMQRPLSQNLNDYHVHYEKYVNAIDKLSGMGYNKENTNRHPRSR